MKPHTIGKTFLQFDTSCGYIDIISTPGSNTYDILVDKQNNCSKLLKLERPKSFMSVFFTNKNIEIYIETYVL